MLTAGKLASAKRFDAGALLGRAVHVLLDLTYAGQTHHLARQELLITSTATGEQILYAGDLADEVEWEEAIELFSSSADSVSVPVAFTLPVDVPALVQRGHDLLQATGELSLWIEGTAYEARRVLLRGRLTEPTYGYAGEPVTASLESEFSADRSIIPDVTYVITEETWPLSVTAAQGMSYPIAFGVGTITMSPAYMVVTTFNAEVLLIAGHLCVATSVTIWVGSSSEVFAVVHTTDALGRTVATVSLAAAVFAFTNDDDFYVSWNQGAGGLAARDGSSLSGAGDVMEVFLGMSTMPVDYGRLAAAKPYLNQYKIAGCIVEGVSPYEWVTANLLPILPCSLVTGPNGLYVIPWRYAATARDAVATFDTGIDPEIELAEQVLIDGGIKDVVNRFKLRYALSNRYGTTYKYLTLGGDDTDSTDTSASLYCRQSQARYGVRTMEEESSVLYDTATAGLILSWWARAKALPTRVVTYAVPHTWGWLERGDVVTITHAELHMVAQPALLESATHREDGTILMRLRIVEDVARHFREDG